MAEIKQQPRVWHLNWSDIRSLEGRGAYLYNPKGEMVAIIFEQDRPEAEGVTVKIMESLNATASPTESDKGSGRWWCPRCGVAVLPSAVTFNEIHDPREGGCGTLVRWEATPVIAQSDKEIVKRYAAEIMKPCGDGSDSQPLESILTRFLAEARDVDANELLQELAKICPHSYLGYARVPKVDGVTVDKLAAALVSAQKGKSK